MLPTSPVRGHTNIARHGGRLLLSQSMLVIRGSECGMCEKIGVAIDEFLSIAETELVVKITSNWFCASLP